MPVVERAIRRGFFFCFWSGEGRRRRASNMFATPFLQMVTSPNNKVERLGRVPTPLMMMSAVWSESVSARVTSAVFRISPLVMCRFSEMVDCETPAERRAEISFSGVRARARQV